MITDKITVYGHKQEAEVICDLLSKCLPFSESDTDGAYVYLSGASFNPQNCDDKKPVIIPFDVKNEFSHIEGVVTYSDVDSSADVCAINPQKRKDSMCFEILCGVFMSRVFIPQKSEYTLRQVLVCASVLYALGVPMKKVVSLLNESLK